MSKRKDKQKQTVCVVFMTNTHEDNTDSSDEEYTYQQILCYRLVRSQQTEHHPQTEQRLRAKACEFHPAVREEADTQDQGRMYHKHRTELLRMSHWRRNIKWRRNHRTGYGKTW